MRVHFILKFVFLKQTLSLVRTKIPRMRIEHVFEWVLSSVFHVSTLWGCFAASYHAVHEMNGHEI